MAFLAFASVLWIRIFDYHESKGLGMDYLEKQKLINSHRFQGAMQHYQSNMCVQYPSEEEYLRIVGLREQQKIELKQKKEQERWRKQDGARQEDQKYSSSSSKEQSEEESMGFVEKQQQPYVPPSSAPLSSSLSSSSRSLQS